VKEFSVWHNLSSSEMMMTVVMVVIDWLLS